MVFELDASFEPSVRTVDKPPFEVHEVGWGQFSIGIKLIFHDSNCKPVEVLKDLILFDDLLPSTKRSIVNEEYNELVFIEPSAHMLNLLTNPVHPDQRNQAEQEEDPEINNGAGNNADKPEEEQKEQVAENG